MIVFATLTLVDYGIFLVLILSAILSTLRGMTRELLGLAGWVASILVAKFTAPMIETPIADFLQVQGAWRGAGMGFALCRISCDLVHSGKPASPGPQTRWIWQP
jgi:hypothetical protein